MSTALRMLLTLSTISWAVFAFRKIKQEKETETGVPSIVTTSIRHAAAKARDAEKAAVAAQKDAEEKKALAESALAQKTKVEKEKEDAAQEGLAAAKEAGEKAKAAAAAACATISAENAWNSAEEDRTAAQQKYTDAVEKRNTREAEVNESIRKLKAEVAKLIQEQEFAEDDAKKKTRLVEELRIAHVAAKETDETAVKELKAAQDALKDANDQMEKASVAATIAAQEEAQAQLDLDEAVEALTVRTKERKYQSDLKKLLWELYDVIDGYEEPSLFESLKVFSRTMRKMQMRDECPKPAYECVITDKTEAGYGAREQLEPVLTLYNEMILKFLEVQELYPEVFTTGIEDGLAIKDALPEIEKNLNAEIILFCDPTKALTDPIDLDAKCGSGLWPLLGLKKNRFE